MELPISMNIEQSVCIYIEHSQTTSVELEGKKATNMEEILNRKRAKQMK